MMNCCRAAYPTSSTRPHAPLQGSWTWVVLVEPRNGGYAALRAGAQPQVASAIQHLFDRLDAAHAKVGMHPGLGDLPHRVRIAIAEAREPECRQELDALNRHNPLGTEGRTIVIEAGRPSHRRHPTDRKRPFNGSAPKIPEVSPSPGS